MSGWTYDQLTAQDANAAAAIAMHAALCIQFEFGFQAWHQTVKTYHNALAHLLRSAYIGVCLWPTVRELGHLLNSS
jgi:hypothetical protein